jgi:hypothetical protein
MTEQPERVRVSVTGSAEVRAHLMPLLDTFLTAHGYPPSQKPRPVLRLVGAVEADQADQETSK